MSDGFIRSLAGLGVDDRVSAGGKADSLGRLLNLGLPVPPGCVLLATAYDAFLDEHDLRGDFERLTRAVHTDSEETVSLAAELTSSFEQLPMPESVASEISAAVERLPGDHLVVRSSATVEDTEQAAWAGQLETYMNVSSEDTLSVIRKTWASLFSAHALAYAKHRDISLMGARVAVILQQNVDAAVSGVVFTTDPGSQNEEQLFLEAVFGLGETLVGGTATPDSYWVDKATLAIVRHRPVIQKRLLRLREGGGTQVEELPPETGSRPKLNPEEVEALSRLAMSAEAAWGRPVDVEWCKDRNGNLYLLQARPITTLNKESEGHESPRFAKSITRAWSLLFCEIWHKAYTEAFYRQFGWGLSDVMYEGVQEVVHVYRAPSEFVMGMTEFVTKQIDANPAWLQEQAGRLIEMVKATRAWLHTVSEIPLPQYTNAQLVSILDDFKERNIELGPRYVLMLWYPIQMEEHPERTEYAAAIDAAIKARKESHAIGGEADEFARRFAAEVLRRNGLPGGLARATPDEMLRKMLTDGSAEYEDRLRAFSQRFLVTRDGVLHESVETYCARKNIQIQFPDEGDTEENLVRGVPAFAGKVRGTVQVVRGREDFPKFEEGNILVTSMTTPDFEVIMNRAAGIVTDEGGVTSHAAILARELRKPTVIGTETATRLFSSGDLAEVDADDGIALKVPVGEPISSDKAGVRRGASARILVVEDNEDMQNLLVREFYRQGSDPDMDVIGVGNLDAALESFRNLRRFKFTVNAVVVDLLLRRDPLGGVRLVEQLRADDYPAEQIFVYSAMATALSKFDDTTRREVFDRLEAVGVSKDHENVFGKVRPGEEAIRSSLIDEVGELATIQELATAVLTRVGVSIVSGSAGRPDRI
jgi:pyruvate, water dikinase